MLKKVRISFQSSLLPSPWPSSSSFSSSSFVLSVWRRRKPKRKWSHLRFENHLSNIIYCHFIVAPKPSPNIPLLPVCWLAGRNAGQPGAEQEEQQCSWIHAQQLQQQDPDPVRLCSAWWPARTKLWPPGEGPVWCSHTSKIQGTNRKWDQHDPTKTINS